MNIERIQGSECVVFNENGEKSIAIPLLIPNLPRKVSLDNSIFVLKSEFHATVLPIIKIKEKNKIFDTKFDDFIIDYFCRYVENRPIEFIKYTGEFRIASKRDKKTIIAMCELSNLPDLYKMINEKYNLKLEVPPAHVTMYTLYNKLGIFIIDSDDINKMTKSVKIPELESFF